ncbi:GxxExxY protein [Variovorax ginsengisoli]|uniref:GxxExxY protein n=1 Tax=Variovorax ginsengisoli TaxID=363844 RepID=A0ABT8S4M7_9BURK|nr:GxxExxY protein [Variovorax ginsengisoli]MDN8614696.1 GxxExxY protein [Variovorax ginsengisoli]MDO1533866.1 GxxExxY protein [Variovorax ginsengisoli]
MSTEDNNNNDFSHEIIGAAVEVQRVLGTGLPEAVYAAALEIELAEREIGFQRDVPVAASYKGRSLGEVCRAAFVVEQSVVVELRAVDALTDLHRAQAQAAVRLSGLRLGLLINFNVFPVVKGVHRIGVKP